MSLLRLLRRRTFTRFVQQVAGEFLCFVFVGFHELRIVDRVVFDHVDEVCGYAPVNLDQVVGIFDRIIDVFEEDVLRVMSFFVSW